MSAREVIRQIEALPFEELREVMAYMDAKKAEVGQMAGNRVSFKGAKKHGFTTYRDVLEKLAK